MQKHFLFVASLDNKWLKMKASAGKWRQFQALAAFLAMLMP